MELNIGTNIKRLRLEKGFTQEQLAELLCVSTAAVSKWESQNTYPDITLLFPLASIFGISIDELLGYDEAKAEADIDNILRESKRLFVECRYKDEEMLIENARKKYPHDYRIMNEYLWLKILVLARRNTEKILENHEEVLKMCDCILEGCTIDNIRNTAIEVKARLLHAQGDTDRAVSLLAALPGLHAGLATEALFNTDTAEFRSINKMNGYVFLELAMHKFENTVHYDPELTPKEKVDRLVHWAEVFAETSEISGLEFFCICECIVYRNLSLLLTETEKDAKIDDIIFARERQFTAMEKVIAYAEKDEILKRLIEEKYKNDNIISVRLKHLINETHQSYARLREYPEYMEMIHKWER